MTTFEQLLSARFGDRVAEVACRRSLYASSFFIDEIDIRLDDGAVVELVAKAAQWDAKSTDAERAKPSSLWNGERECAVYETILANSDLDCARYYGSYVDGTGVRYLLLERIPGVRLWECGEFEAWREAGRWLARLHARVSAETAANSGAGSHLLHYDRQFYQAWMPRARTFLGGQDLSWLTAGHAYAIERLLDEPLSFLHGEFYSSNILVERRAGASAVRPIDWEMAAFGPALMDVACLVAGRWSDAERADVADAYVSELMTLGREAPSREEFLRTLDCCLIHLSVQNLGWSDAWTPPADHAYDWLGEALRLCEKWQI